MFKLHCSSYSENDSIPLRFVHSSVHGGGNISPGFHWTDSPILTKSFALSIIDPHPVAENWVHWLVIDISPVIISLAEGASGTKSMPEGSKELQNTYEEDGYGGPAPPPGSGAHPYVATVYALDVASLPLKLNTSREQFLAAIEGHVLAEASTTGYYER